MTNTDSAANNDNNVLVKSTLYKERATPSVHTGASICNISATNMTLANVYQQTCAGLVRNIQEMLSPGCLVDNGITELLCTGSMFTRHPYMLTAARQIFTNMSSVTTCAEVDAAFGAILLAC